MWIIVSILSAVVFAFGSVFMKSAALKKCPDHYILWGLYLSGSLFFLLQSYENITSIDNVHILFWSLLIAIGSFYGNWFVIKALELGPASLTAPMLNINLPFIIAMSIMVYGEDISALKVCIILLLLTAIVIIKFDPNEDLVVNNKKWFLWVFLGSSFLFLREGGLKITQELQLNNSQILLYSYAICLFLSSLIIFMKEKPKLSWSMNPVQIFHNRISFDFFKKSGIYFGLAAGVCSGLGLYLYSKSLYLGPASLVALIFSSRSMVIVVLSYFYIKSVFLSFKNIPFFFFAWDYLLRVLCKVSIEIKNVRGTRVPQPLARSLVP